MNWLQKVVFFICACANSVYFSRGCENESRILRKMALDRESVVATALNMLAEANLSSVHSSADLRKLVWRVFLRPSRGRIRRGKQR